MKDVNKKFSTRRITNPEEIIDKKIENSYFRLGNNALYMLFKDNTFFTVHHCVDELCFNFELSYLDYRRLGLITDEEAIKYAEASIQSQKDSNTAWELKELKRLKEKYEGKNDIE